MSSPKVCLKIPLSKKSNHIQARILAPDIGQCPSKNRAMFGKSYFTMDTVVRREVNFFL